jgi:outer membrane protein TolC
VRRWLPSASLGGVILLTACTLYHPRPLPEESDLSPEVPRITVPMESLRLPGVTPHAFDPSDGLDITEVATLAVINNPQLRAERAKVGIASAEVFAAGLWPDPQLSLDFEHPISGPPPLTEALSASVSEALWTLLAGGTTQRAAQAAERQTDLEIVWEEWQVAQQARTLFVKRRTEERLREVLSRHRALMSARWDRAAEAMRQGNLTLDVAANDLAALLDSDAQIRDLDRQIIQTRSDLNALLGLTAEAEFNLAGGAAIGAPGEDDVESALRVLPERRPDLLALRAGYESQNQRLRQAILNQFPSINVGVSGGRDTGDVYSAGVNLTLNLPLFDRNRGKVAIAEATRERLWHEYQARLDQAHSDVHRLWREMDLQQRQLSEVQSRLPELEEMTDRARQAFDAGNLDALTYLNLETNLLSRHAEQIRLEGSLMETRIALETLLGQPMPAGALDGAGSAQPVD